MSEEPIFSKELDTGWQALQEGRFADALNEAQSFISSNNTELAREANTLAGMSFFNQREPAKALPYFRTAAEDSDDVQKWLNVMSSAGACGEVAVGEEALETLLALDEVNPSLPLEMSRMNAKLYFAWALCTAGQCEAALTYVEALRPVYEGLNITDDHFLFMRGVPFFGRYVETAKMAFAGLGQEEEFKQWIKNFGTKLDEEGRALLAGYETAAI